MLIDESVQQTFESALRIFVHRGEFTPKKIIHVALANSSYSQLGSLQRQVENWAKFGSNGTLALFQRARGEQDLKQGSETGKQGIGVQLCSDALSDRIDIRVCARRNRITNSMKPYFINAAGEKIRNPYAGDLVRIGRRGTLVRVRGRSRTDHKRLRTAANSASFLTRASNAVRFLTFRAATNVLFRENARERAAKTFVISSWPSLFRRNENRHPFSPNFTIDRSTKAHPVS